jgi:hypothetical protein
VVHPLAGRQQPQQLLGRRRQRLDAQHQRLAQRRRQRAAPVQAGGEQLLGEQRVALAAQVEALDEPVLRRRAQDVTQRLGELGARQRGELDPARAPGALELGQQRPQRVAAVQLVGAVGADDEHALTAQAARQERQEVARRAIRPVQVLDHQHDGVLRAELLEQGEERFEEPALSSTDVLGLDRWQGGKAEAGEEARQFGARAVRERVERGVAVACQWSQCGDDGRVWQLALPELDAVARKQATARRLGTTGGLVEDPGLADPRLTRYEDERRAPRGRVRKRGLELRELGCPADHPT